MKLAIKHTFAIAVGSVLVVMFFMVNYSGYYDIVSHWQKRSRISIKSHIERPPGFLAIPIKVKKGVDNFFYKLYPSIEEGNSASIIEEGCQKPNTPSDQSKVVLVTGFIDYTLPKYRKMLPTLKLISDRPENETIEARHMEVVNVLQINLLHPMLDTVHVIVTSRNTAAYLKSLDLKNSHKLVVKAIGKDVGLKEQLEYASECLEGRVIAITNQDNTIGKGWDNKEYLKILKEKNVMYGLTRHSTATEDPAHGSKCLWMREPYNNCDLGGIYWGSHDTFIFQVRKSISSHLKELDDVTPDKPGMENVFLWFFNKRLNYIVLNPCKVLFVHHHHCVPIRSMNRPRINGGGKSVTVGFSSKLE